MYRFKPLLALITFLIVLTSPVYAQDRSATGNIATTADSVSINTAGMATLTLYVTGTFSQTNTPQLSPDGTNWITAPVTPVLPGAAAVSTVTAAGQWQVSVAGYKLFRLYGTSVVSGTAVVWEEASPANSSVASGGSGGGGGSVTQGTTPWVVAGNVASGATDSGNPVKTGGVYNTSAPTLTNGQRGDAQMDSAANLKTYAAGLIAGEDLNFSFGDSVKGVTRVEQHGTPAHISTNTTTVVKSGAGFLHTITICTKGASSNTATVYDNTAGSGTVLAVIDTTSAVTTLTLDDTFSTGLTIVTATGTAPDLNVSYR